MLPRSRRVRAFIASIGASVALVLSLVAFPGASQSAQAADLSAFAAGNIISDAVFFNDGTMTQAQIQSFLQAKTPSCSPAATCLKDYYDTTTSIKADAMCDAYSGGGRERASAIIYKVAKACGINPQVLIVMLQKEQGLVTNSWPTTYAYNFAMGANCPDSTGCDGDSAGFFIQVYSGAWQMKRYSNPPGTSKYFTWYAPGKTWNIKYDVSASCGTKSVYVQNQATANLYYYTPYTPNAAALKAGYGTGDSCSSYGNRNFYNYFTDWFGSTHVVDAMLYKVGVEVWLRSGSDRYHVTAEAYPEYKGVLGKPLVIDAGFLKTFRDRGDASFYVRNSGNGTVALLQGGQTHRFASCTLVSAWGGACGASLVQLSAADFRRFGAGAEMTSYAMTGAASRIYRIEGDALTPVFDRATAGRLNGGAVPYTATMRPSVAAGYTVGDRLRFAPGDLIVPVGTGDVYMPMTDGRLVHLPSWTLAAQLGLARNVVARPTAQDLTGYAPKGDLSAFVICGGKTFFAAGGAFHPLQKGTPAGFTAVTLDGPTCERFAKRGDAIAGELFVKVAGTAPVYHLTNGAARWVANGAQLTELNGGTWPTIVHLSADELSLIPTAPKYLTPGSLVRAQGTSEVWFVDGGRLLHLPSWGLAAAYGLPSPAVVVRPAEVNIYSKGGDLTEFVTCAGKLYAAGGGTLARVTSGDSAGNAVTKLASSTCASLRLSGEPYTGAVFLTDGARTAVAAAGGFIRLADRSAVLRANGGAMPDARSVTSAYFSSLPAPTSGVASGDLVRADNSPDVTLANGNERLRLPNWGLADDLGVTARYRVLPPTVVANLPETGTDLTPFVICDSKTFVAAQGTLSPVSTTGLAGLPRIALTSATCATLDLKGPAISGRLFVQPKGDTQVYVAQDGVLRRLGAGETPTSLNGGVQPRILVLDPRTIAGLPRA